MTEPIWFQASCKPYLHELKRVITRENVNENRREDGYGSPLSNALLYRQVDCVRWLVQEMGANVHDAIRIIHFMPNTPDIICILCAAGVNPDFRDTYGDTLMSDMLNCRFEGITRKGIDVRVMRALVACGSSQHINNVKECSPTAYGHFQVCVAARAACKQAARTLLYIGRLQPGGRDVCGIIARLVWQSRRMVAWEKE